MNYNLTNNTKTYLTASLDHRIQNSPKHDCFEYWINKNSLNSLFESTPGGTGATGGSPKVSPKTPPPGGFGGGMGSPTGTGPVKYPKERDPTDVLLGDSAKTNSLLDVAAMYGGGAAAGILGNLLGKSFTSLGTKLAGTLGGAVGGGAGGLVKSLTGQLETLSGKDWIDANVSNIAQSQMQLAAQGAGSPWVPLAGKSKKK